MTSAIFFYVYSASAMFIFHSTFKLKGYANKSYDQHILIVYFTVYFFCYLPFQFQLQLTKNIAQKYIIKTAYKSKFLLFKLLN